MNGVDVSEHQPSFPDGAWDFAIIRVATGEASDRPDHQWLDHYAAAKARDIPVGAYYFADPRQTSPEHQADRFLEQLTQVHWDLIPWCDLEVGSITREWEDAFNYRVRATMGAAGTYASDSVFLSRLASSTWPRWVAAYPGPPRSSWAIHQYRGSPLDLNVAPSLDAVLLAGARDPTVPTGADLLECAYPMAGLPYSTAPGRTLGITHADCSGLIVAAWNRLRVRYPQLPEIGGTVSTTIERWATANGGRYLTRAEALVAPACCLTVGGKNDGWTGSGPKGHITFGVGDGELEFGTPSDAGHQAGFSEFSADHERMTYTGFFTLPGIHLGTHAPKRPRRRPMFDILTAESGFPKPRHWLVVGAGNKAAVTEIDGDQVVALVNQPLPPNRFEGDKAQVRQLLEQLGVGP